MSVYSLCFSRDGSLLFCGLEDCIKAFDTSRPGRDCTTLSTYKRKGASTLKGIVSTLSVSPDGSFLAAGGYSSKIAVYATGDSSCLCSFLSGHRNGVTQVKFSPDGRYLASGARKDSEIRVWDLRNTSAPVRCFRRAGATNQRIWFDFNSTGKYIFSGSTTVPGEVLAFSLNETPSQPQKEEGSEGIRICPDGEAEVIGDCVNSVNMHMSLPLIAVGSGQRKLPLVCRRFDSCENDDSSGSEDDKEMSKELSAKPSDNMLRIMKLPFVWKEFFLATNPCNNNNNNSP